MSQELFSAVGRQVRRLREERGLSLEDVAKAAALNRTYVWKAEQGMQNMSLQTIGRLAFAFGVPPTALFEGVVVNADVLLAKPRTNARDPARRPAPSAD